MSDIGGAIRSIDELVEEVTRLHVLLRGSEAYPGILEQASDLAGKLASVRDQLGSAARLSEQLDALPDRLLRSADDQQFKAALRESIAQVLADAIVDARRHVQDEAAQVAIDELSAKVKVAMSQLGESSANFLAERNKLRGLLESEQIKSTQLAKRLEYFEQDKDNALRLLSADFVQVSKRSGKARLIDFGLGVAMALIVSLGTLYPAAANYLKAQPQHHHSKEKSHGCP